MTVKFRTKSGGSCSFLEVIKDTNNACFVNTFTLPKSIYVMCTDKHALYIFNFHYLVVMIHVSASEPITEDTWVAAEP